jgi:hypothetical protein
MNIGGVEGSNGLNFILEIKKESKNQQLNILNYLGVVSYHHSLSWHKTGFGTHVIYHEQ